MKNALQNIDEVLLMGPGPSCVAPAVYEAMARKTLGHMDASFLAIMDEIKGQLQTVLQTGNRLTIPVSGTGRIQRPVVGIGF